MATTPARADLREAPRAVADQAPRAAYAQDAVATVLHRDVEHPDVAGRLELQAPLELAHRAVHDGDPIVAPVENADVTELVLGIAACGGGAVTVDRVAVQ